ncbi:hypothetical protein NIES970_25630 [[Synechococcus] sp. NIES-970]|nr:hypothetical protein NIES970_25630 [[Synechococcus] sp. NIES-970]
MVRRLDLEAKLAILYFEESQFLPETLLFIREYLSKSSDQNSSILTILRCFGDSINVF